MVKFVIVVCLRSVPFCGFTTVHKENGQYRQKGWMEMSWGDLRQKRNLQEIRPSWFRRQE